MNNTRFRFYIKDMPTSIIAEDFGMRPIVFKGICQLISLYGDYETGSGLKMSWRSISEQAGVDRKTAFKVRDILLENGLLIEKNKLTTNISVYDLGAVVPFEDLRGPFSDNPTGHNSIDYLDIIEDNESSNEDSYIDSNTIKAREDFNTTLDTTEYPVAEIKEIPPAENYWSKKAEEIWG